MRLYAALPMVYVSSGWGIYWLATRHATANGFNPLTMVAIINFLPLLALLLYSASLKKGSLKINRNELLISQVYTAVSIFYTLGIVYTTVVKATVLFFASVFWSVLISKFFFKEDFGPMQIVGIILGFSGAAFVMEIGTGDLSSIGWGEFVALLSGICWSVALSLMHRYPNSSVFRVNVYCCLTSIIFSLVVAVWIFNQSITKIVFEYAPNLSAWFWLYTIMMLPAFLFATWCARVLKPVQLTMFVLLEILVAATSAAMIAAEAIKSWQWVGIVMILLGVLLESQGRYQREFENALYKKRRA